MVGYIEKRVQYRILSIKFDVWNLSPHKRLSVFTLKPLTFSPWCWAGRATARWSPCSMTPTQPWPSPLGGRDKLILMDLFHSKFLFDKRIMGGGSINLRNNISALCFVRWIDKLTQYAPGYLWAQEKYGETRAEVMFSKGGGGNKLKNNR